MSMKWTQTKPTTPGYYFYKDNITDHDVIPVDYLWEKDDLSYWNEFTHSWMLVKDAPEDVKWSDKPINFPEEQNDRKYYLQDRRHLVVC